MKGATDWILQDFNGTPNASVTIDPDSAWKLFSKSRTPENVIPIVKMAGDKQLAMKALEMVSVMA
jgi:hypothetical protein